MLLGLLVNAIAVAVPPDAASERARVVWSGCPGADEAIEMVEQFLGHALEGVETEVRATVGIEPRGDRWTLTLTIEADGTAGRTELSAETCEVAAGVAALKIAMAIDPMAVLEHVGADPVTDDAADRDVAVDEGAVDRQPEARDVAPSSITDPPRKASAQWFLRNAVILGSAELPGPAFGISGATGVVWTRARVELTGSHHFTRLAELSDRPGSGAAIRLWTLGARGCGVPSVRTFEFPLCVGMEAGVQHAQGVGLPTVRTQRQPWIAAVGGAGVAWRFADRVAMWAEAGLSVPLVRTAFSIEEGRTLYRAPPAGARATLGLELRLP